MSRLRRKEVCEWLGYLVLCVVVLIVYDVLKPPLLAFLGYGLPSRYYEVE